VSRRVAAAALALLALPSCKLLDWAQDRTRTCDRLEIELVNRSLVAQPVNLVEDGTLYADANLLRAGESRRITECVAEGDHKRFRAGRGGVTLDIVNCLVTREDYEREFQVARVIFDNEQLDCENW
jgi:hypothetical protein